MNFWTILGVAVGLAMDAFAVSIAAGMILADITPRHVFRLAFHFGLFQFLMPIAGWALGRQTASWLAGCDHWVAFGLLAAVAGKMLFDAWRHREQEHAAADPTRGMTMVSLSLATSLDAFAVGVSIALLRVPIFFASVVIGLVAASFTIVGIHFGNRIGARWERYAELFGGGVLALIAVATLFW
jgi:manganese efflux pump family protein